jgi:hypothetical protein
MSRQNIGDAALVFIRELDKFDITGDRSELINGLRDQCLTRMYDSATHVENARRSALEILIDRIPKMSDNMLIRTIEFRDLAKDLLEKPSASSTEPPP